MGYHIPYVFYANTVASILQLILKKWMWGHGLNSTGSGLEPMAVSYELHDRTSGAITEQ
jgi:hypothetical protein